MKQYLLLAISLLALSCKDSAEPCGKNCKDCKKNGQTATSNNTQMTQGDTSSAMSCKLTSPELRKRKEEVISQLTKQVLEKKELADGYSYKFNGTDEMLDTITAFIKSERQCCDFFNFRVSVTNDAFIWLEITGAEGAKEFITTELEM